MPPPISNMPEQKEAALIPRSTYLLTVEGMGIVINLVADVRRLSKIDRFTFSIDRGCSVMACASARLKADGIQKGAIEWQPGCLTWPSRPCSKRSADNACTPSSSPLKLSSRTLAHVASGRPISIRCSRGVWRPRRAGLAFAITLSPQAHHALTMQPGHQLQPKPGSTHDGAGSPS